MYMIGIGGRTGQSLVMCCSSAADTSPDSARCLEGHGTPLHGSFHFNCFSSIVLGWRRAINIRKLNNINSNFLPHFHGSTAAVMFGGPNLELSSSAVAHAKSVGFRQE